MFTQTDYQGYPELHLMDLLRYELHKLQQLRKLLERDMRAIAQQERRVEVLTEQYVKEGLPHF